jgi:hypothetical protein
MNSERTGGHGPQQQLRQLGDVRRDALSKNAHGKRIDL